MREDTDTFFLGLLLFGNILILTGQYCCAWRRFIEFKPVQKDQSLFKLTTYRLCCCNRACVIRETDETCIFYKKRKDIVCECCTKYEYRYREIGPNESAIYDEIQVCIENARRARQNDFKASESPNDAMMALLEKEYAESQMELLDFDQEYDQLAMTQNVYDQQLGSDSEPKNDSTIYAAIAFPAIAGLVLGAICWKKRAALKRKAQEETDDYIAI